MIRVFFIYDFGTCVLLFGTYVIVNKQYCAIALYLTGIPEK